jgi:cytochrome c-type biogenesis protein CcmH/NrfG
VSATPPNIDAEERTRLEAERDFLLRSLDDLESERASGGIDDDSYRALHDDYTARAAATIRALRDGVDARAVAPPLPWTRRVLVVGLIIAFAIGAGVALAAALGARLPGQTSSGNTAPLTTNRSQKPQSPRQLLEAAIKRNPNDVASRFLLAKTLETDGDLAGELKQYDAIIRLQPTSVEAYAQSGRALVVAAGNAPANSATTLLGQAKARLDKAVALDPEYPDARYFRAVLRHDGLGDVRGAQSDAQRYLILAPNGQFADLARSLLAAIASELKTTTPTG